MINQRRHYWRSLAGGEIAPEMYGRVDLAKNQTGVQRCYNFMVTPQGVAENRAGSTFISSTKDNGRAWLRSFVRPNGQGILLEMGDNYVRAFNAGNKVLAADTGIAVSSVVISGITAAEFTTTGAHGLSVDDPVTPIMFGLVNSDAIGEHRLNQYMGRKMFVDTAPSSTTLTLKTEHGVPVTLVELAASPYDGLISPGFFVTGAAPTVLELAVPYSYSHARQLKQAQFVDELALCHTLYAPSFIKRTNDQSWGFAGIAFNQTLPPIIDLDGVAKEVSAMDPGDPRVTYRYVVTSLREGGEESGVSNELELDNVLRVLGNSNDLNWSPVAGAWRYHIYKGTGTGVHGFIGSVDGSLFTDDNIAPDYATQPAATFAAFNSVNNYPGVVLYHGQRAWFANTVAEPQSFWASGLAGFGYFNASFPPLDDQGFTYELSSKRAAPVLHAMALRDVLFFTAAGVFRVYSKEGGAFTPTNIDSIPVGDYGAAAFVDPQELGNNILFPLERGFHLHALSYDGSADGYEADDLSLVAPHLIDEYSWLQTGTARSPYPIWWGLRSDGRLIGLTYISKQQVYAWFQVELPGGVIESFTVVPEGQSDALYAVVRRVVDGSTVRYIERIGQRYKPKQPQAEAYFVDCGVTYRGAATDTVTGLSHLEGEDVVVLADGRPLGPYTVAGGQVVIDDTAEVIHVGLPYRAEIETLPLHYEQEGYGVGIEKNISAVYIRFRRSAGVEAGTDFAHMRPMVPPVDELLGDIPILHDGVKQIDVDNEWDPDARVCIRQTQPLPASLSGLAVDFADAA